MNVILQTPPEHAPAFNPLILVIQAPYYRILELQNELGQYSPNSAEYNARSNQINALQPYYQQKTLDPITVGLKRSKSASSFYSIVLNRTPDANGKATFDLSYLARNVFQDEVVASSRSLYLIDGNIAGSISLEDEWNQLFFVGYLYNAVQQYDVFNNSGMGTSRILTETIKTYPGYPILVSIYSSTSNFILSTYPVPNGSYNAPVGGSLFDFSGVIRYSTNINGSYSGSISVPQGCVPDRPFYVRWVNQQGGYNYWMFRRQTESETTNEYETIIVKRSNIADGQRTIFANVAHTVATSADLLTEDEFNILKGIAYSPRIQWYNETMGDWVTITISEDATTTKRMWSGFYSVSYTFALPQIQTQF